MEELVKLLRKAKDKINNWSLDTQMPGFPIKKGEALGDALIGEAPDEIQNWAYGDYPVRVNPDAGRTASYVPEIVPGRQKALIQALMAVPTGGGNIGKAGMLPAKPKHAKYLNDWVGTGIYPYADTNPNTVRVMERLVGKAPKMEKPTTVYRTTYDDFDDLNALQPGDVYTPNRMLSTTKDIDRLEDIKEGWSDSIDRQGVMDLTLDLTPGTNVGGKLPPMKGDTNYDYYNEFVVNPGAAFEVVERTPNSLRAKSLTESEALLKARIAALRNRK